MRAYVTVITDRVWEVAIADSDATGYYPVEGSGTYPTERAASEAAHDLNAGIGVSDAEAFAVKTCSMFPHADFDELVAVERLAENATAHARERLTSAPVGTVFDVSLGVGVMHSTKTLCKESDERFTVFHEIDGTWVEFDLHDAVEVMLGRRSSWAGTEGLE